jgi:hypothetical protein
MEASCTSSHQKASAKKDKYKTLPLINADQRGSAQIPSTLKSEISKREADMVAHQAVTQNADRCVVEIFLR